MTGDDTAPRKCAESYCDRPVWPIDQEYCVLHSRLVDKTGFWAEVLKDQNPVARSAFDAPEFDLSSDPPPDTPKGREFRIDLNDLHFPGGELPAWLFNYDLLIGDSHFHGVATFKRFNPDRKIVFLNTEFHRPVYLWQVHIGNGSFWDNCRFGSFVTIRESNISQLLISRVAFGGPVILTNVDVLSELRFKSCVFRDSLEFEQVRGPNVTIVTAVIFDDVEFTATHFDLMNLEKYKFHGCRWKRIGPWWDERIVSEPELGALRSKNRRSRGSQDGPESEGQRAVSELFWTDPEIPVREKAAIAEEQFRHMRRVFTAAGNAEFANEFHLSEIESRRLHLKKDARWMWSVDFWALWVHKWLSYYNIRFLRPLFWLVFLLAVLTVAHNCGGFSVKTSDASWERGGWLEAVNFTVSSMMIRGDGGYVPTSVMSLTARTVGQVFGPALVLVFAFSLRRRYRVPSGLD